MARFLFAAFGSGLVAVIIAMVFVQVLASDPHGGTATLREDDLVCVMEAAFAAGVAAFSFWSTRTGIHWFVRAQTRLARVSIVLTAVASFAAFALLGFFIERRFEDTLQRPSLRAIVPALLAATAIVLWQRRTGLARHARIG